MLMPCSGNAMAPCSGNVDALFRQSFFFQIQKSPSFIHARESSFADSMAKKQRVTRRSLLFFIFFLWSMHLLHSDVGIRGFN